MARRCEPVCVLRAHAAAPPLLQYRPSRRPPLALGENPGCRPGGSPYTRWAFSSPPPLLSWSSALGSHSFLCPTAAGPPVYAAGLGRTCRRAGMAWNAQHAKLAGYIHACASPDGPPLRRHVRLSQRARQSTAAWGMRHIAPPPAGALTLGPGPGPAPPRHVSSVCWATATTAAAAEPAMPPGAPAWPARSGKAGGRGPETGRESVGTLGKDGICWHLLGGLRRGP